MKKTLLILTTAILIAFAGSITAQVTVDFETGDFDQISYYYNDYYYPWTIVPGGPATSNYCIMSGNQWINNSTSSFEITYSYSREGSISFDALCYGEGTASYLYDKCIFYIDDVQQFVAGEGNPQWKNYYFEVTPGNHHFRWTYSKDLSNWVGNDCFAIDNIVFTSNPPCLAPTTLDCALSLIDNSAFLSWNGNSESYTVRYKKSTDAEWTVIANINDNSLTINNLKEDDYTVQVQADCLEGIWTTISFTFEPVKSTAVWFAWAHNDYYAYWSDNFIKFNMQDPSQFQVASKSKPDVITAAYADGYVWFVSSWDGFLSKAPLDLETMLLGTFEEVYDYEYDWVNLSYHPLNGNLYFTIGTYGTLCYFNPSNPTSVKIIGDLGYEVAAFAINKDGQAYVIDFLENNLYRLNLTDATTEMIGTTSLVDNYYYPECMFFDQDTDELFWAANNSIYRLDPNTAIPTLVYQSAPDPNGFSYLTGLFMVPEAITSKYIRELSVTGFTPPATNGHPDYTLDIPEDAHYTIEELAWYWYNEEGSGILNENDTFNRGDAAYYLGILFTPEDGYRIVPDAKVNINGETSIFDEENSMLVSSGDYQSYTVNYYITALDEQTDNRWTLWPNPAKNSLFLKGMEGETVRIYDNTGRLVLQERYAGQLNISDLAPGIYALTVSGVVTKFVKE